MNDSIPILEYWLSFPPVKPIWHHINIGIQLVIATISLTSNLSVLLFLTK